MAPMCSSEAGQSAFLPSQVFQDLPDQVVSLPCPLEITLTCNNQRVECIASAYPQTRERDSFGEVALTVCSAQLLEMDLLNSGSQVKMQSVQKLDVVAKAKSATVTLVCDSITSSAKVRSHPIHRTVGAMKLLLNGLTVKHSFVVKPTNNPVMKSFGIAAVIIEALGRLCFLDNWTHTL